MLVIGLTGGIGSGKSTVAKLFAEHHVPIVDADLIARELVEPEQPALNQLVDCFGPDILTEDGKLDRRQLRNLVFSDSEQRKKLEDILHPQIRASMIERLEQVEGPYVIMVVPLLIDTGHWEMIDQILVVDVDEENQLQRVMQRDGVSRKQAAAIVDTQISREARLEAADQVIDNTGDITNLRNQVDLLHQAYLADAEDTDSVNASETNSSSIVAYELPLTERIRTFLRLETLLERAQNYIELDTKHAAHCVIQTLVEISNLLARGDVKSEILKELERQHASLKKHLDIPGINQPILSDCLKKLSMNIEAVHNIKDQIDYHLQNDLLYNSVRQRLSIPGGSCDFDLPLYNHWLNHGEKQRQSTLASWVKPYKAIYEAITTCLDTIRNSANPAMRCAKNGFYEYKLKSKTEIQLIRVSLIQREGCYPTISASKHLLNVRFMQWTPGDARAKQVKANVDFELVLCGI